jgi:MoxR-like ATPase
MKNQGDKFLFLDIELATEGKVIKLTSGAENLEAVHIFDADSIHAVNAALASGRPLLVRGEPGVGKSQLAGAVAKELQRVFLHYAVDIQTEAKDLLWRFDSIERLAKAQLAGALNMMKGYATDAETQPNIDAIRNELRITNFLHPGHLWWAFDWQNALEQATVAGSSIPPHDPGTERNGCLILIDEIDKAETDVPNGLLEALGAGHFTPVGRQEPVRAKPPFPLVVITTNEERALPDAFLRRCMVLNLELPSSKEACLDLLVKRGSRHFPAIIPKILEQAAILLVDDREKARQRGLTPLPGQAEYLDLLRALDSLRPGQPDEQLELLNVIGKFAFRKHGPDTGHYDG